MSTSKILVSLGIIALMILVISAAWLTQDKTIDREFVTIGDKTITAEVAKTPNEQKIGLSGRKQLTDEEGLLFVYQQPIPVTFWMKDMLIPIDILWIQNGKVIGIEKSIVPDDGQKIYPAPTAIDYVLEVASGWVDRYQIEIGNIVYIGE